VNKTLLALPAVAVLAVGGITAAHAGGDHTEVICHPSGGGYVRISVDKHSAHFDDAGNPKHEHDGRVDVYSTGGMCPGDELEPTEDPTPTDDPTEPTEPTPSGEPTEPTEERTDPTTDPSPSVAPTTSTPADPSPSLIPPTTTTAPPNLDPATDVPTYETRHRYTCEWLHTTTLRDGVVIERTKTPTGQTCAPGQQFNPSEEGM
jgi:hypothetical protein